jgi:hypothetical protein
VSNDDYVVSVGLQWTNRKIGKIVSLYQREMFKKLACLVTCCTQSVNEGLTSQCCNDDHIKNFIREQSCNGGLEWTLYHDRELSREVCEDSCV